MAWTRAQLEFRYLGIGPAAAHRFQELASHLLYPNARLRAAGGSAARNRLGQAGAVGAMGFRAILPMLAVTIARRPRHCRWFASFCWRTPTGACAASAPT